MVSTLLSYLRQRPTSAVALVVLVLLALVAVFAPLLAPHDPNQTNLIRQFEPHRTVADTERGAEIARTVGWLEKLVQAYRENRLRQAGA